MKKIVLIFFSISFILSCQQQSEPEIHRYDIMQKLKKLDPKMKDLYEGNPMDYQEHPIVNCRLYHSSCHRVYRVMFKDYELFLVQFSSSEFVKDEATRVDGLYLANWLFDNIAGEKPLREFLRTHLKLQP